MSTATAPAEGELTVHFGKSRKDGRPARHVCSYEEFADQLIGSPQTGEKDGSYFQLVDFDHARTNDKGNYRLDDSCTSVHGYVADIDGGNWSPEKVRQQFGKHCGAAYTTWSSETDALRWRVVIYFDRPVDKPTFRLIHSVYFESLFEGVAGKEESGKPTQFWYMPRVHPERRRQHCAFKLQGELFEVAPYVHLTRRSSLEDHSASVKHRPKGNDAAVGGHPVITAWNKANSVQGLPETHDYTLKSKSNREMRYLHPDSKSGIPGCVVYSDTGKVFSHSGSDPLRSEKSANGKYMPRDAFDVFRILEHGGDWANAFKAAEEILGLEVDDESLAQATWPPPLNLVTLAQQEPEPPQFIIDDWLPVGYATLLAGHGGVGKSGIALYLAACIAMGGHFSGFRLSNGESSICRAKTAKAYCTGGYRGLWHISEFASVS